MAARRKNRAKKTEADKEAMKAQLADFLGEMGDSIKDVADAPEGFIKQQGDISGSWISCSPIQGIPRSAKLMDGSFEENKSTALVLVELTKPCIISDGDGELRVAEPGEMVGVWYQAGMRSLRWLRDVEVWMMLNPEEKWKDTGKGNPMKTYDVRSAVRGSPMLILEDFRDRSAPFVDGSGKTVGLHDLEPKQTAIQRVPI